MNALLETKLGFDRIRKAVADRCSTEYACSRVENEEFSTDPGEIRRRLALTDEMRLVLMFEESFPASGYIDCVHFLEVLQAEGANIDLLSLGKLRTMLDTLRKISIFFEGIKDGVYPSLKRMTRHLQLFPEVSRRIDSILDRFGAVKDTASDALYDIRKSLKDKEGAVSKRMAAILRKAQQEGIVESDAAISVREGKMVIPVASSQKRKISGFVLDESATGKTAFVQPAEIVELENEISELHFAETREIFRILAEFSDFVRPFIPGLLDGAICLGELDFIMAKAQTALEQIAGMPLISEGGELNLRKARHPLLEKSLRREGKEIVPQTVVLTPIPTSETSELPVFDRIMVDIGDGQSLENDLSTYSSFLTSMKDILANADSRTLVLIDEFGSGTEPAAGGAIAEAILSELDRKGVYGVITTHYTNLKLYASGPSTGVINGAMQFDAAKIEPLFKLDIGYPGNSFAFELARKMGMPEEIVKDAEARAGEEFVGRERNLRKIVRNRRALDEKLQHIRKTDQTLENITGKYQKELEDIKQLRKNILDEARREAEEIVRGANRQVENTIRSIKESQAEKEATKEARQSLAGFMGALSASKENQQHYIDEKLRKLEERKARREERKARKAGERQAAEEAAAEAERKRVEQFRTAPLKVGEKVRIKDGDMVGEVSKVSSKAVTVIIGNISSKLPLDRVERITSNEYKSAVRETARKPVYATSQDASITERKLNFKPEIDVRGETGFDAVNIVDKAIDNAMLSGVGKLTIIHGKGTGVLRREINQFLRTNKHVKSHRLGTFGEGEDGVTIVELK